MTATSPVSAALFLGLYVLLGACKSLGSELPSDAAPLFDMEEPAAYLAEPDDEAERRALPLGGYTGVYVEDTVFEAGSLDEDDLGGGRNGTGVIVRKVVENSPGDVAGLAQGDILHWYGLRRGTSIAGETPLQYTSDWAAVEREARTGDTLIVGYDRAGREGRADITVMQRARPAERVAVDRFREEQRVGVVLRTATEVEAAHAGLAPGAGAVIVGLSQASPWRREGLVYGDVVTHVDDEIVAHPQVVLDAIRDAEEDATLQLTVRRGDVVRTADVPLTRRARAVRNISIPLLYSCGAERGESELSILGGLLHRKTTRAAWEWRVLWLISFSGGDADRLEESE